MYYYSAAHYADIFTFLMNLVCSIKQLNSTYLPYLRTAQFYKTLNIQISQTDIPFRCSKPHAPQKIISNLHKKYILYIPATRPRPTKQRINTHICTRTHVQPPAEILPPYPQTNLPHRLLLCAVYPRGPWHAVPV